MVLKDCIWWVVWSPLTVSASKKARHKQCTHHLAFCFCFHSCIIFFFFLKCSIYPSRKPTDQELFMGTKMSRLKRFLCNFSVTKASVVFLQSTQDLREHESSYGFCQKLIDTDRKNETACLLKAHWHNLFVPLPRRLHPTSQNLPVKRIISLFQYYFFFPPSQWQINKVS